MSLDDALGVLIVVATIAVKATPFITLSAVLSLHLKLDELKEKMDEKK